MQAEDVLDFKSKENPDHAETTTATAKTKKRKRRAFESADAVFLPEDEYRKILTDEVATREKKMPSLKMFSGWLMYLQMMIKQLL